MSSSSSRKSKNKNKSSTQSARRRKGRRKQGPPVTDTTRAGLTMPVNRIRKYTRDGRYAPRLSKRAPG